MNPQGREDGRILMAVGSSGSGKTAWVKQQIRGARRVIVWDPEGEYAREPGFRAVADPRALVALLAKSRGALKVAFVPRSLALFGWWADLAFTWGRLAPCTVVAEETADVTTPGKAPEGWGTLIRRGRKWGIVTYAVTQRPAESDKTAIGNAAVIHCGRLSRAADRRYMAAELDVPPRDVDALQPLEFIERHATGAIARGKLTFPKPRAARRKTTPEKPKKPINGKARQAADFWP